MEVERDYDEVYLTREEAAEYLGISKDTLRTWAHTKKYPLPYLKLGRKVRYALSDLNKLILLRTIK